MSEQLTFTEFNIPIIKKQKEYQEERSVCGGIYKDKGIPNDHAEFCIAWGRNSVCCIFDGINHIEEIVEHGGLHNMELVEGYGLAYKINEKKWFIRNSGIKNQPGYIIAEGSFGDRFIESLKPYLKIFMK